MDGFLFSKIGHDGQLRKWIGKIENKLSLSRMKTPRSSKAPEILKYSLVG
jgi:hypothetical protein